MVEQQSVPAQEAQRILALAESHFLDVKRVEVSPAKLSQSVSAFANTSGGELFIGIGEEAGTPRRFWSGFSKMEDANGLFQVLENMTPLANHFRASFLTSSSAPGVVLHLIVPKTVQIVYATDGHAYVRRNAQNIRLSGPDAIRQLELDKGLITFEDQTVNVAASTITNSEVALSFILDVVPSAEPADWMHKQNLIVDAKPIVAGLLLFSDSPQSALPKRSAIKIYRYKTRDEAGTRDQLAFDPITIESSLYGQIKEAVSRTKTLVEGIK